MRHLNIVGLLAVAAAALMAFAVTASADVATSPTGATYTSTIKASSEGHVVLHNPMGKFECATAVEATIATHGVGKTVSGNVTNLTFGSPVGSCTNGWHFTTVSGGTLSIHGVAGTYNGDVFSSGTTIEATNPNLGNITCRYATNNTTIGRLTGGQTATLDISGSIPFHSGSIFCGSGSTAWTGALLVTTPDSLYIDTT